MGSRILGLLAFSAALFSTSGFAAEFLPTVDLGYQINKASSLDGSIYTFKNIRYGAAPVGKLRFQPPTFPEKDRSKVIDGAKIPVTNCIQGAPVWGGDPDKALDSIHLPRGTEDCLYLDVLAPRNVLSGAARSARRRNNKGRGAPVIVWIHGGGWVQGSKEWYGTLNGLVEASGNNTIVVQINYRLGALGFMNGPTYRASGGVPNLGLLDQRFAMEWVQKYIHLFGGDPEQVTIMGQSAGGGSVVHHLTAYGGNVKESPFIRAISLSPGFLPTPSHLASESQFHSFAAAANCTPSDSLITGMDEDVLECMMGKTGKEIQAANQAVIAAQPRGVWGFGPSVDGTFVPDLPGNLLAYGMFDKNVQVMTGQVAEEAHDYTDININKTNKVDHMLQYSLPNTDPAVSRHIVGTMFPPANNETEYKDNFGRAELMVSEFGFTCNNVYVHNAYKGDSYGYVMSIPPAYHAYDMVYIFNINITQIPEAALANQTVTHAVRYYVSNFVSTGDPNKVDIGNKAPWTTIKWPEFPKYGDNATVLGIQQGKLEPHRNPSHNKRCKWFQKALYFM